MEPTPEHIIDVVEAFIDLTLFVDAKGIIQSCNTVARDTFGKVLTGYTIWHILDTKHTSITDFLHSYPAEKIHELIVGSSRYSLRTLPLPSSCSAAYLIMLTNIAPLTELHETYEERIEDNIAALDDNVTLFNALFEASQDATLLLDASYTILTSNPAAEELFGSPNVRSGSPALALFRNTTRKCIEHELKACTKSSTIIIEEPLKALSAKGKAIHIEASVNRVPLQSGTVFQLIIRDISDIVRLESGLEKSREEVDGMNVALRSVIESVEEEKRDMYDEFATQIQEQILPALDRMVREPLPQLRKSFGSFIKERLTAVTGETREQTDELLLKLTAREMELCRYIEAGKSSERIAELFGISSETVQTHRKNIRRKLGLRNKKTSLRSYLKHLSSKN